MTGVKSSVPEGFVLLENDKRGYPFPEIWRGQSHPLLRHVQASVRNVYICFQDPDPKVQAKDYVYVRDKIKLPEGTDEGIAKAGEFNSTADSPLLCVSRAP